MVQIHEIRNLTCACSAHSLKPSCLSAKLIYGEGKVQEELPSSSSKVRIYVLKSREMQLLFCRCLKPELLSLAK